MLKRDEVSNPSSCLNKAAEDEPVFVLRGKDPCAPDAIRFWADCASEREEHEDEKIEEALKMADQMDAYRARLEPRPRQGP